MAPDTRQHDTQARDPLPGAATRPVAMPRHPEASECWIVWPDGSPPESCDFVAHYELTHLGIRTWKAVVIRTCPFAGAEQIHVPLMWLRWSSPAPAPGSATIANEKKGGKA